MAEQKVEWTADRTADPTVDQRADQTADQTTTSACSFDSTVAQMWEQKVDLKDGLMGD